MDATESCCCEFGELSVRGRQREREAEREVEREEEEERGIKS